MLVKNKVPNIPLILVKSSQIAGIGYDLASKTLAIKFNSGGLYHYEGVDAEEYLKLTNAKSIGTFFGSNIKNVFKYTKIGDSREKTN